jgi:RNA polymerase sigma-70 factor (ECF subfamily)
LDPRQRLFVGLLDEHRKILFKVAAAYARTAADRQELVQETVFQLWRSFGRYDPALRFSTWMYRVALNVAISHVRSETRKARTFVFAGDDALQLAAAPTPSTVEDDLLALRAAIDGLGPLDRALVLLYLDGQGHEAIAQVLGISATNVGTRIGRIKQKLRREMSRAD